MNPDMPVNPQNASASTSGQQFSHEQIVRRAEQIWRERNCPTGRDEAIWLEAESQLQAEAESRPVSGTPSRPYVDEPGIPIRRGTKVRDPADSAAQTRTATDHKSRQKTKEVRTQ